MFLTVIAVILLILPIFDWGASFILHRASTRASHDNIALRERSRIAIVLAIATSLNAFIASNRVFELHMNNFFMIILLSISLLLVSVPNLYWLYLYYSNKLRK